MSGPKNMHRRRHMVGQRDGWRCNFCGRCTQCATCNPETPDRRAATLDHIIPKAEGGTNALTNLCIACKPCNEAKANGVWPDAARRVELLTVDSPATHRRNRNNRYTRKYAKRRAS